jgi:tRNA pseudouridine13 synthase
MKPGHLAGNRFAIALRGIEDGRFAEVAAALDRAAAEGVPNAFGAQRYGKAGDNAARALAWIRGAERPPRDPRVQRLLWSALQSSVFDAVLEARRGDGTWATPLEGDLLKLRSSGGLFLCADVQTDRDRAARGEVSPTGPIVGARMRSPEGAPADLERRVAAAILGEGFDMASVRRLGEGSRRALRLWVDGLRYDMEAEPSGHGVPCMRVYFVLPKGAYATTVLGNAINLAESHATQSTTLEASGTPASGNEEEEEDDQ